MKKNLMYIITLITLVIALNYLHATPYPSLSSEVDIPFFLTQSHPEIPQEKSEEIQLSAENNVTPYHEEAS
jgi:hypothetical protein